MKILFCTDGSQCSFISLRNASSYVRNAQADIICVVDWNFLPESMNIENSEYTKDYENISDSILNYAEKFVTERNIRVARKIKIFGSASDMIIDTLKKNKYDLVVMGSQGKKGIQKWLGSVSRHVAENSDIPCFISKRETENTKILITTDGSSASNSAAVKFADEFNCQNKDITILYVKENPDFFPSEASFDRNWLDAIEKQQKIQATKALNKLKMLLENYNIEIKNEVILTGNPAQAIIEYCNCEDIDLVVMGARSKSRISKLLLGSVSSRVLDNVDCTTLVINEIKENKDYIDTDTQHFF